MITPLIPLFGFDIKSLCSFAFLTNRFDVSVSHVESINVIYVQNVKFADNLAQLLDDLYEFYENNQGKLNFFYNSIAVVSESKMVAFRLVNSGHPLRNIL